MEKYINFLVKLLRKIFYKTWLHRLPITDSIYRKLIKVGLGKRYLEEEMISFRGLNFFVKNSDITIVPSMKNGLYEKYELDVLLKFLSPGGTIIDIGANIGIYSVLASEVIGPRGKIYSFEPEPRNYSLLEKNIAINRLTNVSTINKGVADKPGQLRLFVSDNNIGTHSMTMKQDRYVDVDVVTIDDFAQENNLSQVDLIKCDVEGFEPFVLNGMKRTIARCNPYLILEYFPKLSAPIISREEFISTLMSMFKYVYIIDGENEKLTRIHFKDLEGIEMTNLVLHNSEITGLFALERASKALHA